MPATLTRRWLIVAAVFTILLIAPFAVLNTEILNGGEITLDGDIRAREGSGRAEESLNNAEEGSNRAEEGSNRAEEGLNRAEEGLNRAEEGSNLVIYRPPFRRQFPLHLRRRLEGKTQRIYMASEFTGRFYTQVYTDWRDRPTCDMPCDLTKNLSEANAVVFFPFGLNLTDVINLPRNTNQYWIYYNVESPIRSSASKFLIDPFIGRSEFRYFFNWTATFLSDSDIVIPYGRTWKRTRPLPRSVNFYSPGKKRRMAFVLMSNCWQTANRRPEKINELRRHIQVDIYGGCGANVSYEPGIVYKLSEQYRFYLSFENSFCRDYITEKFFLNAMEAQSVPVVFGGTSRYDYEKFAPSSSFIYALDFSSMKQLANRLNYLANNEAEYAKYFEWRRTHNALHSYDVVCSVCEKLLTDKRPNIADLNHFSDPDNCRNFNWQYLN